MTETPTGEMAAGLPEPIPGTPYGSARGLWAEQARQGNIPKSVLTGTRTVDVLGGPPGAGGVGGGPPSPDQNRANDEVLRRNEVSGRLPVGAEHVINTLLSAEVGEDGDLTRLNKAMRTALAYREGLTMGTSGAAYEFDPTNPADRMKIAGLQRMMTTVEGAVSRSGTAVTYINAAIEDALDGRVIRSQEYHDDPVEWSVGERLRLEAQNEAYRRAGKEYLMIPADRIPEVVAVGAGRLENEYKAIPGLVELRGDADSREVFDQAFIIRMRTCESPELASQVGNQEKLYCPTPDSPHWAALFGGEVTDDGKGIASVLEEIIKIGLPESVVSRVGMEPIPAEVRTQVGQNVYAKGFESAIGFGTWLNHLLEKANGKMDVVWGAWKLGLTMEVIDTLGQAVEKGKFIMATPPLGSALMTFLNHLKEKRMVEYGLKADGARDTPEKFVGHSGLPMGIEHTPDLCSDYLHQGEIKFDRRGLDDLGEVGQRLIRNIPKAGDVDYEKRYDKLKEDLRKVMTDTRGSEEIEISLWDLWLYGRIGFADPNFPWYQTDQPSAEATPGELALGSFGLWLLRRSRANKVLEDLKLIPGLGGKDGLGNSDFFSSRIRNWVKVLGKVSDNPKNENYKRPEDNPRAWWVLGLISLHQTNRIQGLLDGTPGFLKEQPELDYLLSTPGEELTSKAAGREDRGVSREDVFYNAVQCGFLRKEDVEWIRKKLGMVKMLKVLS